MSSETRGRRLPAAAVCLKTWKSRSKKVGKSTVSWPTICGKKRCEAKIAKRVAQVVPYFDVKNDKKEPRRRRRRMPKSHDCSGFFRCCAATPTNVLQVLPIRNFKDLPKTLFENFLEFLSFSRPFHNKSNLVGLPFLHLLDVA